MLGPLHPGPSASMDQQDLLSLSMGEQLWGSQTCLQGRLWGRRTRGGSKGDLVPAVHPCWGLASRGETWR